MSIANVCKVLEDCGSYMVNSAAMLQAIPAAAGAFTSMGHAMHQKAAELHRAYLDDVLCGKSDVAQAVAITLKLLSPARETLPDLSWVPPRMAIPQDPADNYAQLMWPLMDVYIRDGMLKLAEDMTLDSEKHELHFTYGHQYDAFKTTVTIPLYYRSGSTVIVEALFDRETILITDPKVGLNWLRSNVLEPLYELNLPGLSFNDVRSLPVEILLNPIIEAGKAILKSYEYSSTELYFKLKTPNDQEIKATLMAYNLPCHLEDEANPPSIKLYVENKSVNREEYLYTHGYAGYVSGGRQGYEITWENLPRYYQDQVIEQLPMVIHEKCEQ